MRSDFLVQWIYSCAVGLLIGWVAWGPGRMPLLSMVMPLIMAIATCRRQAFLVATAYGFATQRELLQFTVESTSWSAPAPLAAWIVAPVIGGIAWSLYWTRSSKPWAKALACLVGWLAVLFPPAGEMVWGSSLAGWGYVVPGFGWGGVLLSALVPAIVMVEVTVKQESRQHTRIWVAAVGLVLTVMSFAPRTVETRIVQDIVGASTDWKTESPIRFVEQHLPRVSNTARQLAAEKLARVLIYPAGVVQMVPGEDMQTLMTMMMTLSRETEMTIVLGAVVIAQDTNGGPAHQAIAFYPNGKSVVTQGGLLASPYGALLPAHSVQTLQIRDGLQAQLIPGNPHAFLFSMLVSTWLSPAPLVIAMLDHNSNAVIRAQIQGLTSLFGQKLVIAGTAHSRLGNAPD